MKYFLKTIKPPKGECHLISSANGICWASIPNTPLKTAQNWALTKLKTNQLESNDYPDFVEKISNQLKEYFEGSIVEFNGPFDFYGTPFQIKVWQELLKIPFGKTTTYGQIAKNLNQANSSRAVGAACGANNIAILIPCHRVISTTQKLTGYAWGISFKKWLLTHESKIQQPQLID